MQCLNQQRHRVRPIPPLYLSEYFFNLIVLCYRVHMMFLTVSLRLFAANIWVQSQASPCGAYG